MTCLSPNPTPELVPLVERFTFTTWGRRRVDVEADAVTFQPGHVVFWRNGRIVRTEPNSNVLGLEDTTPRRGDA